MNLKDTYLSALDTADLFESSAHRTRFKELLDCFSGYSFFSKGLCKCMYLSAWDDEHFVIILEILNAMALGKDPNTNEMRINGDILAEEQTNGEYYVYLLSNAFLDNKSFHLSENAKIEPENRYIIEQAPKASEIIDSIH